MEDPTLLHRMNTKSSIVKSGAAMSEYNISVFMSEIKFDLALKKRIKVS